MEIEIVLIKKEYIDFYPESLEQEIIQNVNMIISTTKGSVPLDRNFGISSEYIDLPIEIAKARYSADIVEQIEAYEPRCTVISVSFEQDDIEGILKPKVKVRLIEQS